MESGVELQPLVDDTPPALRGFDITERNLQTITGGKYNVDLNQYEHFDMCFPLRKLCDADEDVMMTAEEVEETILAICVARREECHFMDFAKKESLHELYKLETAFGTEMPKSAFRKIIVKAFRRWLKYIGAETDIVHNEDQSTVFVQARLTEATCERLAEKYMTPLQIDIEATPYPEFREDEDYVAPFHSFDQAMERIAQHHGSMKTIGRIWTRYDRMGNRISTEDFDPTSPECSLFREVDRMRLLEREVRQYWSMHMMVKKGFFNTEPFVLHQTPHLTILRSRWAQLKKFWKFDQPLDEVRNYFGEEIALYFAFKGLYTRLLLWPAILGTVLYLLQQVYDPHLEFKSYLLNMCRIAYCVFLCSWVTWFHQHWARREEFLRIRWGMEVSGMKRRPLQRQAFKEDGWKKDDVFPDKWEKTFSKAKLRERQMITLAISVVGTILCVIIVNNDLNEMLFALIPFIKARGLTEWFEDFARLFFVNKDSIYVQQAGTIFFGVLVKVLDSLWKKHCAFRLADFENCQFDHQHAHSVSTKLFLFKFMDHFSALFYIAFFKVNFHTCKEGSCLKELRTSLVILFLLGIVESFKDVLIPIYKMVKQRVSAGHLDASFAILEDDDPDSSGVERQFFRDTYIGKGGLISDWLDTMVQFGLLSLFSMVMPLLPMIAMLANLIDIRMDAFRVTHLYRRPLPRPAPDIGFWRSVVRIMGFLAVLSNIVLCVFVACGRHRSATYKLTVCLTLLISALVLREAIQFFMPEHSRRARLLLKRMHLTAMAAMWGDEDDILEGCYNKTNVQNIVCWSADESELKPGTAIGEPAKNAIAQVFYT